MWTARCKSGYVLDSTGRPCSRPAPRGMLLCADCLDAEVIPMTARSWMRITLAFPVALFAVAAWSAWKRLKT